jgi:hypothetical protein
MKVLALRGNGLVRSRSGGARRRGRAAIGCELLEGRLLLAADVHPGIEALRHVVVKHHPTHGKAASRASTLAAIQQAEQTLARDLQTISGHAAISSFIPNFENDIVAIEGGVRRKPTQAGIANLQSAYQSGSWNQLEQAAASVLLGDGVPSSLINQTDLDLEPILESPGLTASDQQTLATDFVTLVAVSAPLK